MDQPGKVAEPARGQLNRDNKHFPITVRVWEIGLARRVRLSRPASACSFPILRLNLVLTHGIPPDFRGGVHYRHTPSGQSGVYRVTQLRTDGAHSREAAGMCVCFYVMYVCMYVYMYVCMYVCMYLLNCT